MFSSNGQIVSTSPRLILPWRLGFTKLLIEERGREVGEDRW